MLNSCGYDVRFVCTEAIAGEPENGQVVGLGATAHKQHLVAANAHDPCHLIPCFLDRLFGASAKLMCTAALVAVLGLKIEADNFSYLGFDWRRGIAVQIDRHFCHSTRHVRQGFDKQQ